VIYNIVNGKIIFDVSLGMPNYGQRNNEYKWKRNQLIVDGNSMCNITAYIASLSYCGFQVEEITPDDLKAGRSKYKQPEDRAADFIMNDPVIDEYYRTHYQAMYANYDKGLAEAYTPLELHVLLCMGVNRWLGTTVAEFRERASINDILYEIMVYNRPVVMSGTFPYINAKKENVTLGHVVSLVGLIFDKSALVDKKIISKPEKVIIDDPYGNVYQNYQGSGNNIEMAWDDFIKWFKPLNDVTIKMAHFFKSGAPTIA
jgi:hypothetical protein